MTPIHILIVDDEEKITEIIDAYLRKENYYTHIPHTRNDHFEIFYTQKIDLIILDLMLPDISGEKICLEIRKTSNVPIIMLTAKTQESDALNGFSIGSDDYVTKPFSPKLLVARIKALLARVQTNKHHSILSFNHDDLIIDFDLFQVKKKHMIISLTPSEFNILKTLVTNPNRIFSRSELIEKIFSEETDIFDRTIDSHIKNLRAKIEDDTKHPIYIITVHGIGYKFKGDTYV